VTPVVVDSDVLLDVVTDDPVWGAGRGELSRTLPTRLLS
jgi:hypothetical protein